MIKNSLWKRILFGYIAIVVFMLAMSFYLIFRLNYLNKVTDSVMRVDIPFVENGEKLVDSLLEQIRNEKKYIITNDNAFLDLFGQKRREFQKKSSWWVRRRLFPLILVMKMKRKRHLISLPNLSIN